MLRINLLPPERRQRERTPLPRFIILLVGVALVTSEIAVIAWGYSEWQYLLEEKEKLETEKESLKADVEKYNQLKQEISNLEQRREVLKQIRPEGKKEKYQWSYALDQLFTVIDQSPGVWINGLNGKMEEGGGQGASSSLSLGFETKAAAPLSRLTKFQKLMKKRLIQEEQVFTNMDRVWHSYSSGEEQEKEFWTAQYTLKKVAEDE